MTQELLKAYIQKNSFATVTQKQSEHKKECVWPPFDGINHYPQSIKTSRKTNPN